MALVKENIENLEDVLNDLEDKVSGLENTLSTETALFNNDNNYQIFVSGTEIGTQLNEKLQQLIEITKSLTNNEAQNIIKITSQFVQIQKELNQGGN